MSYLHNFEEDFNIKNPLNSDDKHPMNYDGSCPNIMTGPNANLGRIHFATVKMIQKFLYVHVTELVVMINGQLQ